MSNRYNIIHLGKREPVEKGIEHNWTVLDPYNTKINKPTILIFGGNNTDNPSFANGYAKLIENLMETKHRKNTDIMAFNYQTEVMQGGTKLILKEYEEELRQIYASLIEPLLLDNVGNVKEKQGIEKTFKNIVFVGHCAGCDFVNLIFDQIYNTLSQKYPMATAENLMKKIQYVAYAPTNIPSFDTNSLFISPSADAGSSWAKTLAHVFSNPVDKEYPKGLTFELTKQKNQLRVNQVLKEYFEDYRAIVFRQGSSLYVIPGQMNQNYKIGDHSIECIASPKILNNDTDYAQTAQVANEITKMVFNNYFAKEKLDNRQIFNNVTDTIYNNSPISQREFS